jgi:hypothetical protein
MTKAVQYIYYTQRHLIRDHASDIALITRENKQRIVQNAIAEQEKRKQELLSSDGLSDSQRSVLEDFLNNNSKWVEELNSTNTKPTSAEQGYPATYEAMSALMKAAEEGASTQAQFVKQLNNFLDTVEKEYLGNNRVLSDYTKYVTKMFINNKRVGSVQGNQNAQGNIAGRIIEACIRNTRTKAFRVRDYAGVTESSKKLDSALLQLTALRAALGRSLNYGGGTSYMSGRVYSTDKNGKVKTYWDRVREVVRQLVRDFQSLVGEMGVLKSVTTGSKETLEVFETMERELNGIFGSTHYEKGNRISCVTKLREDDRIRQDLQKMVDLEKTNGRVFSMYNTTTNHPKADISFFSSDDKVQGKLGISVKDYETHIDASGINVTDIKLQNSTPLLTLMLRECDYGYDELVTIMNIGAARPVHPAYKGRAETQYESSLNSMWERIKENVQYKAVLSALAGLGEENERVFYLSANNVIYSVTDILSHLSNTLTVGSSVKFSKIDEHMNRSKLQALNERNYIEGHRDKEHATSRSEATRLDIMAAWYNAKINVTLNLAQMQSLLK